MAQRVRIASGEGIGFRWNMCYTGLRGDETRDTLSQADEVLAAMRVKLYSYRYAQEILQHESYRDAWQEIMEVVEAVPLFLYAGKSVKVPQFDVVQQVMNTYFSRRWGVDLGWEYNPLATNIEESRLRADFRKDFGELTMQVEVQFGNMARWYSDVFKFQTAYSQGLTQVGLSVVPMRDLALRIDSNVAHFERAVREIPSAELSITLPILLVGLSPDESTPNVDLRECRFSGVGGFRGPGSTQNRFRIVDAYLNGTAMSEVGPDSPTGPMPGV